MGPSGPVHPPTPETTPVSYFDMMCGTGESGLVQLLVQQTNLYAAQYLERHSMVDMPAHSRIRDWRDVTADEMRAFLGLLLAMGVVRKATMSSYWNDGNKTWLTHTPSFGEVMTRNRFQVCFSGWSYIWSYLDVLTVPNFILCLHTL